MHKSIISMYTRDTILTAVVTLAQNKRLYARQRIFVRKIKNLHWDIDEVGKTRVQGKWVPEGLTLCSAECISKSVMLCT